jgi:hypothetical protein
MSLQTIQQCAQDCLSLRRGALRGYQLSDLQVVTIEVASKSYTERGEAEDAFTTQARHIGWGRRESWAGRTPSDPGPSKGAPLDGEWVLSEAESARLIHAGGLWRFICFREVDPASATAAAQALRVPALRETILLIGRTEEAADLRYAVYWGVADPGDPSGIRRLATRFLGYEPKRGQS